MFTSGLSSTSTSTRNVAFSLTLEAGNAPKFSSPPLQTKSPDCFEYVKISPEVDNAKRL